MQAVMGILKCDDYLYHHVRYWAVAVPVYACLCFWLFVMFYIGLNHLLVLSQDDPRNIAGMCLQILMVHSIRLYAGQETYA